MERIENETHRQVIYSKQKVELANKAMELFQLCGTDIAFIMFSSDGEMTSFVTNGRVEDIFLRVVDRPNPMKEGPSSNEEYLSQRLQQLRNEKVMLDKIAKIEALEDKLEKLKQQKSEAEYKMRYYDPDLKTISSVSEAEKYQQFLMSAMQHLEQSKVALADKEMHLAMTDESAD